MNFQTSFNYIALVFSLIFFSFYLMYLRVFKKDKNQAKNLKNLFYARHFLIFVLVGICSFILAKSQIGLRFGAPGFLYAFLGPLCYFHSKWFHKKYNLEY